MAKPLVSSNLFSFPKLLLWSIPLLLLAIYTYAFGGLDIKFNSLVSLVYNVETELETKLLSTHPTWHDETFTPHFVLRVTEEPFTQSCITKQNVILVNGTSPGPELRLKEGRVYWIRVFNDMDKQNLTMVSNYAYHSIGT